MAKETVNTSTTQVPAQDENIILLKNMTSDIGNLMKQLVSKHRNEAEMSGRERQRMFGAGVRNYGFIEKSFEILRENPKFHPANFDAQEMINNCEEFDQIRQLSFVLDQFSKSVNSIMLASSDKCYRSSLILYRHLKEQAHNKIQGAEVLWRSLLTFFKRNRRSGAEPVEKEVEADFNKMLHGNVK